MYNKIPSLSLSILIAMIPTATLQAASIVYDNYSAFQSSAPGANITSTGSTPNTFIGDAYILAAGTDEITGFDFFPVVNSGSNYTGLKINIWVWDTVNSGTVNAGSPAFSSLLASYSDTVTGTFTNLTDYALESGTAGTPLFTLATPLTLSDTTVGITINVQGTTDGITYATANGLTSAIATGVAPTVGSDVFNGYYRNAASETNGNFTSTIRSLGLQDQTLALRIYGISEAVTSSTPEPATTGMAVAGVGLIAALRRRRK